MILKSIELQNWRNFSKNKFYFNPFLTIIIGENARGKTNIIEGIYFLLNGFGFREKKEEELIFFDKEKAKVEGEFFLEDNKFLFKIILKKNNNIVEKEYLINNTKQKLFQYQKNTQKTVLFFPTDLEIIDNSPSKRRRYFDNLLSMIDPNYKSSLNNYENALKKRNKLLQQEKNESLLKEEIFFWDSYLEKQANLITQKRQEYVNFLNNHQNLDSKYFSIEYIKNEFNQKKAKDFFYEERKQKQTLIGPQRDDFQIYSLENNFKKNIHRFGSRSEQRLALFWLKINEINFLEEKFKNKPLILLDDIFSELDWKNQQLIIKLTNKYQTIITTNDINILKIIDTPKSIIKL